MAEGKKSFLLYVDLIHTVKKLSNEQAGELFKHILSYVNDEHPVTENVLIEIAFEPIKQGLKRDLVKYEEIREKRIKAGIASAEKKQQNATNSTHVDTCQQSSTLSTVSVNDNVSVNVNVIKEENISSSKTDEAEVEKPEVEFYLTKKQRKLSGKRLETFLIFWKKFNYPKGKAEAADAWIDIPDMNPQICEQIYLAAEIEAKQRSALIAKGRTPKMAQGWLSARRWEDDVGDAIGSKPNQTTSLSEDDRKRKESIKQLFK